MWEARPSCLQGTVPHGLIYLNNLVPSCWNLWDGERHGFWIGATGAGPEGCFCLYQASWRSVRGLHTDSHHSRKLSQPEFLSHHDDKSL